MYGKVSGAGGGVSGKGGVKLAANAVDVSIKKKKVPLAGTSILSKIWSLIPCCHSYSSVPPPHNTLLGS